MLVVGLLLILLSGASQAETWIITDQTHPVTLPDLRAFRFRGAWVPR